jgi:hypothetical protein
MPVRRLLDPVADLLDDGEGRLLLAVLGAQAAPLLTGRVTHPHRRHGSFISLVGAGTEKHTQRRTGIQGDVHWGRHPHTSQHTQSHTRGWAATHASAMLAWSLSSCCRTLTCRSYFFISLREGDDNDDAKGVRDPHRRARTGTAVATRLSLRTTTHHAIPSDPSWHRHLLASK